MAQQKEKYVSVDQLAQAFRISERAVQRMAIYDGMPRKSRGAYPYFECLSWFIAHLQKKVCRNCDEPIHAGPCRGMEAAARAEWKRRHDRIGSGRWKKSPGSRRAWSDRMRRQFEQSSLKQSNTPTRDS